MGGVKEMWSIREEHINEWGSVLCGGRSRGGGGGGGGGILERGPAETRVGLR